MSEQDDETGMTFVRELRADRSLVVRFDNVEKGQTWFIRAKAGGSNAFTRAILFRARDPVVRLTDLGTASVSTLCTLHDPSFCGIEECREYFELVDYDVTGTGVAEVFRGP